MSIGPVKVPSMVEDKVRPHVSGGYTKQGECMTSAFTVTLDCHSPETLAAFWGAALH